MGLSTRIKKFGVIFLIFYCFFARLVVSYYHHFEK